MKIKFHVNIKLQKEAAYVKTHSKVSDIQNLELLSLNSDDVKSFTVGWETESIRVQINSETHRNRKDFYKSGLHSGQLVSTATSPCWVLSMWSLQVFLAPVWVLQRCSGFFSQSRGIYVQLTSDCEMVAVRLCACRASKGRASQLQIGKLVPQFA